MARITSTGKCALCGALLSKSVMTRHLASCQREHPPTAGGKPAKTVLLQVEGRDSPDYWMYLELRATAELQDLDQFLRGIWLECCGHLSAFTIDGVEYTLKTGQVDSMWMMFRKPKPSRSMNVQIREVLRPGTKFIHQYDFGTTTTLTGRMIGEGAGKASARDRIRVLARNLAPQISCSVCGEPAIVLCSQCTGEEEGPLCRLHGQEHECGEEMQLPIVNSPRVGQCGYTGPSVPNKYFDP
jgi:hypothetical protein